jgi:hypothetical protein
VRRLVVRVKALQTRLFFLTYLFKAAQACFGNPQTGDFSRIKIRLTGFAPHYRLMKCYARKSFAVAPFHCECTRLQAGRRYARIFARIAALRHKCGDVLF